MDVSARVRAALANYGELPPILIADETLDEELPLATPNRLAFALGWVVGAEIVKRRYADSLLDVLPIYHPEQGWDRFLLGRRVASTLFKEETANAFGMILLDEADAPAITRPSGAVRLSLGAALAADPQAAVQETLALFPATGLPTGDPGKRWKERQVMYPRIYDAVAELIAETPGMAAAREIYVDDQAIDGVFHPLYLHGVVTRPMMSYDWFLVQYGSFSCFINQHGVQTIYRTDRQTWSTVKKSLLGADIEEVKRRIKGWLRIDSEPDSTVD